MRMPLISVILPVYNAGRHLEPTLNSLLAQTFGDFEVVCLDDGSTDRSPEVLARMAAMDARFKVFRQANAGIIAARNAAIARARAPFLALQDQDDLSEPRRFELQLAALVRHPQWVLVGTQATLIDSRGRELRHSRLPTRHEDLTRRMAIANPFFHCSVMLRRSALDRLGRAYVYPEVDDYELLFALSRLGRTANLADRLYRYRVHTGQYSSRHHVRMLEHRAKLQREIICPALGVPYQPERLTFALLDEAVHGAHQHGDRSEAWRAAGVQLRRYWWHWRPYSWIARLVLGESSYRGLQRVFEGVLPA